MNRATFRAVEEHCGFRAMMLLFDLVDRARVAPGSVNTPNGRLDLERGEVLFSSTSASEKLGVSDSSAYRDLQCLRGAGLIETVSAKVRLNTRRASAPTIVTIVDFDAYQQFPRALARRDDSLDEEKEGHDKRTLLGEGIGALLPRDDLDVWAKVTSTLELVRAYDRRIKRVQDQPDVLTRIENNGLTLAESAVAACRYEAFCVATSKPEESRMKAWLFFSSEAAGFLRPDFYLRLPWPN